MAYAQPWVGHHTVDAYLDIAQEVLRSERRPMTPRAIMAVAYQYGIVEHRLYGKTQHKTLGARLSVDIVQRSERSLFFRPAPGRFFLREFLTDTSIPEEHRRPIPTRRRFRELVMGPALALDKSDLAGKVSEGQPIAPNVIFELLRSDNYHYEDPRRRSDGSVFFRAFVCVQRNKEILTYRLGRYRESRDAFMHKRCVGFATLVHDFEHTLFTRSDLGIVESGVRATKVDLDIPDVPSDAPGGRIDAALSHFIWCSGPNGGDLLAVICFECPPWFEPTRRRLALNDVSWLEEPGSVNNIEDFDPWSQKVLASVLAGKLCKGGRVARTKEGYSRTSRE
ncbi:winged helix-turn-helix domain-containing protein [Methylobacterium sp. 6HR-1]|uniref:HTH HARE-type domain-containing protein n=1 Tax=Methylobacterium nonmethylotrophicum TaxID=1141884 RepID=A0A4Z0NSN0_9HYPH|nr:hypothetical protein EU555_11315 [Methylobacterium nonmethylotrophicum]